MGFKSILTPQHYHGLKDHKYKAEGKSLFEYFMQSYWNWLVLQVPLWVAPNLLTFAGLVVNVVASLAVILWDANGIGAAPRWVYLCCAFSLWVYLSLDGIDGKQARRTGTNNQLGELFDHGCDAISTFVVCLAGASACGLNEYPYIMLLFVLLLEAVNYIYHWQTYVSGVLHFKKIDCTEGQFCHIAVMTIAFFVGTDFFKGEMPIIGMPLKYYLAAGVIGFSVLNVISAFNIILTKGKGKHGSTIADTSILSPMIPLVVLLFLAIVYSVLSPGRMLHTNSMLFLTAMAGPLIKYVIYMMVAGMCKSSLPLYDIIMIGPVLAVVNLLFNCLVPELITMTIVAVFVVYDTTTCCIILVKDFCYYLNVSCFTIPYPPPSFRATPTSTSQNGNTSQSTSPH